MSKNVNLQENLTNNVKGMQLVDYVPEDEGITIIDNNGNPVISKTYSFINPTKKRSEMKVFDSDVIVSLEKIGYAIKMEQMALYVICAEFNKLNKKETLERYGFKTIGDLGHQLFGYKANTVNQYARIGKIFLDSDGNMLHGLPRLGVSHLLECLKLCEKDDPSTVIKLFLDGILTDGMSTKVIRGEISNYLKKQDALETTGNIINELPADTNADKNKETSEKEETDKKEETINTEELEANTTVGFDIQVEIGKILNNLLQVVNAFSTIESQGLTITGVNEKIEELVEYAKSFLK